MKRLTLILAVFVIASTGTRVSFGDVSADIERELRAEGVSLAADGIDIEVTVDGDGVFLLLVSRSDGKVLARQFVDGLPAEPEAVVAHLTIVVASMVKRTELSAGESRNDHQAPITAPGAPAVSRAKDRPVRAPSVPTWVLSASGGRGAGLFLAGETEQLRSSVDCCLAFDGGTFRIALGRRIERRSTASFVVRYGITGANRPGHATAALAGLGRFTFAPRGSMNGVTLHAEAGVGLIRTDVRIGDQPDDMDVDTHASGPALIGGGGRWATPIGSSSQFYIESTLTAGLPLFDLVGAASHAALHLDLAIGLAVGL